MALELHILRNAYLDRVAALFFCVLALLAFPVMAQPVKIGHIDTLRIERESIRPKRGAESLKKEFAAREQAVREMREKVLAMEAELQKLGPTAPAAEMARRQRVFSDLAQNFEQVRRTFVEDVDRRRAEERQKFFAEIKVVVQKIAVAQKFDLVVEQGVHASRAVDITDQVIKALDGK